MNEIIITPEMKEDAKKCNGSMACGVCKMPREFQLHPQMCIEAIASLPGVWDEAPEWADCADVTFTDKNRTRKGHTQTYTRTLPKSLEDEIKDAWSEKLSMMSKANLELFIPVMLKEYNERQVK
jgi:hypothetical protein